MSIHKKIIVLTLLLTATTINFSHTTAIKLVDGKKYYYAVVCTDYCGSKSWDATYLDADIFIEYQGLKDNIISFYTRYNTSTLINRSYSNDYGVFNLTEHYFTDSRTNNKTGAPAWQWIGNSFPTTIQVTVPYFFLAHAPQEFAINIHDLDIIPSEYTIKLSNGRTIKTYEYTGDWTYQYEESNNTTTTVVSYLNSFYDVESGLLIRMDLEMLAYHETDELASKEPVVDSVGSFKMTYVESTSEYRTSYPIMIIAALSFIILLRKRG